MSRAKGSTKAGDAKRREVYVQNRIAGMLPTAAARAAGYTTPRASVSSLENNPDVQERIQAGTYQHFERQRHSRDGVLDTIDEAIDMAKMISDPGSMIRGAQEINKMQGYYAPEEHLMNLSDDTKQRLGQLANMSEAALLEKLGKAPAYIDAEFEKIPNAPSEPPTGEE